MVNCPVCQAEIIEDFGLVTCSSCGSQVLLELDQPSPLNAPAPIVPPEPAVQNSENMIDELSQVIFNEIAETSDMSDVAEFGNSQMSQGREGMLRFNLYIGGIDTSDIREEVRWALTDAKFLWDADQFMNSIHNGELAIKAVTPVKSALLLQRLRAIPVEIRWEQYAIHQS